MLRSTGKRSLRQLPAFSFVVTVALSAIPATVLLTTDVAFLEGVTALALLIGPQLLIAAVSPRWPRSRNLLINSLLMGLTTRWWPGHLGSTD